MSADQIVREIRERQERERGPHSEWVVTFGYMAIGKGAYEWAFPTEIQARLYAAAVIKEDKTVESCAIWQRPKSTDR